MIIDPSVAGATALLYDYLLAFGNEVDFIWARKWNLVTLLYAIGYLSLYGIFRVIRESKSYANADMGNMSWTPNECLVWYQLRMWGPYVFRIAMDIIMMKRVYALSCSPGRFLNSSRWVVVVMAIAFIVSGITSMEAHFSGVRVCGTMIPMSEFVIFSQFPTLGFEVLLFILAFGYFVADVWDSWRSKPSNSWKVNDIVQILVRDSTIYFAMCSVYIAVSLALQSFIVYCFAPRLVLNLKEHENRAHMSGLGEELSDIQFMEGPLQQSIQSRDCNP
ncbi:hypothetical protein JVU11DRAFT_8232 [Chiua virens]|nr:hypothetical protein JVU11DRAFT_8232 [Chiua virens]